MMSTENIIWISGPADRDLIDFDFLWFTAAQIEEMWGCNIFQNEVFHPIVKAPVRDASKFKFVHEKHTVKKTTQNYIL